MSSADNPPNLPCLCGSRRLYARCCGQYLGGAKTAPTAEALMRSRYTAFAQGNVEYLTATHHPAYRPPNESKALQRSISSTQWLNLMILGTQKGQRKDTRGTVEFAAAYRSKSAAEIVSGIQQLHERSQFIKEKGQWFYTEGEQLPPFTPKRDQPCWCGSGKRFKHCHQSMP
ncbi:MAG: YchJ family metal-binding protein [Cyanobacteria bacterium P01_D01_bin.105]